MILASLKSIVNQAKESGIDAIIASDHAAITIVKSIGMPLHISTQSNMTNLETVELDAALPMWWFCRGNWVCVRLLRFQGIKKTNQRPSGELVKLEVFIHGALCMAVSGKCYLSLHSNNASANRGACIQNCRKQYIVTDKEDGVELEIDNEYIMSAKDLCTIGF